MDLRHLRHFVALAEAGSLHQAARRLRLQQPTLSASIRSLETDVGTQLVNRSTSGTRLTQAGEIFLNEAQTILTSLDQAMWIARQAGISPDVSLRLGIARDIVTTRLTNALSCYQNTLSLGQTTVTDTTRLPHRWMLEKGVLDLALLPSAMTNDYEHSESLWDEDIHLILSETHPLVSNPILHIHQLVGIPLILDSGHNPDGIGQTLLAAGRIAGLTIDTTLQESFLETRLMLVAAGFGISVLPASSQALATIPGIVGRPLSPSLKMTTVAVWPTSGLTPSAKRFLAIARAFKEAET